MRMKSLTYSWIFFTVWILVGEGSDARNLNRSKRAQPATEIIKIYKNINFSGDSSQIRLPYGQQCVNLDPGWNNSLNSIDFGDLICTIVFEDSNCHGKGIRLQKFSFGTMNLESVGLKNTVSSIRQC